MSRPPFDSPRLRPQDTTDSEPTIGRIGHPPFTELARLAAAGRADWALRQLMALAGYEPTVHDTEKSVGAYIFFVTRPEIVSILDGWSPQSRHAASLLRLSACVGTRPDLIQKLRPFKEDTQTSTAMRGSLADEPLTAMIASRRAVILSGTEEDKALAHWLEQLRAFLLLRALQLLEAGATQDRFLGEACAAVRKACDRYRSDQIEWFRLLESSTTDFADFAADLEHRCTLTRPVAAANAEIVPSPGARKLFSTLRRIAAGGAWWDPRSIGANDSATRNDVLGRRDPTLPAPSRPAELPVLPPSFQGIVPALTGDETAGRFVTHEALSNATPAQARKHGRKILLANVERSMYLPSTWHRLTATEEQAIVERTAQLLGAAALRDRVGAALTLIALVAARGMFDVETIACSDALGDDWTLDVGAGILRRRPPRFQRGAKARSLGPDASQWLCPIADSLEIQLCSQAASALRAATTSRALPENTAALWSSVSPDVPLAKWFDDTFASTASLKRLTGPVTEGALGATVFARSRDAVFAQLLSSQLRTALPAACAYGAYRQSSLEAVWKTELFARLVSPSQSSAGYPSGDLNAAGSELDADLTRIAAALEGLVARYEAAASDAKRWVESHNLLTSMVVVALLASTGARPVNSPFELRSWLDLGRGVAYVEDKRSGPTTGARICLLSRTAVDLLLQIYLPHLESLEELLRSTCPLLASAVGLALLQEAEAERPLPLLFFLRAAPDFGWIEVSETQLDAHCGIRWPLPWNIFRHIHAMHLVRSGLHPEIVDALLAHGDRGAESHGDHSLRIPREDIETARPHVDALQARVGLRVPRRQPLLPDRLGAGYRDLPQDFKRMFGARARMAARERAHETARLRAREEIQRAIGEGRPPSALSPDAWQAIGHQMLFRGDGMPHPSASLRYEVFEEVLAQEWQQHRALIQIQRHFRPVPEPAALFTPAVLAADDLLHSAIQGFRAATARFDIRGGRPGPMVAAALGAFELVLSCRLAHPATLLDVAHLRETVRLVRFDGRHWLERANAEQWRDGRPVMRVPLTQRAARWIGLALSSTRRDVRGAPLPELLHGWARTHAGATANTLGSVIRHLCQLRSLSNAWSLPGAQAAHLAGRQVMAALPHHDWYRLSRVRAPAIAKSPSEESEFDDSDFPFAAPNVATAQAANPSTSATRCAVLLDGISDALKAKAHDVDAIIAQIHRLAAASGFNRGDAPHALAHFACMLLKRKRRTGRKDRLRVQTARRYWYSLVGPFTDLGHDLCLIDEDEEGIREFYEDITNWWGEHFDRSARPRDSDTTSATDRKTGDVQREALSHDAARRTINQLKDFQDFAVRAYGIEEADFSGIDLGARLAVGRPALILDSEVAASLEALVGSSDITRLPDTVLRAAFVLVACSRFGLRVGEAAGLYRDDWIDCEGAIVVLVRSNSVRSLKTERSRRQVPLVQQFGAMEREVVVEVIRRWELAHTAGAAAPLLPGVSSASFHQAKAAVSGVLLDVLKQVTRSDAARIHGLRHSYACRLLALLLGVSPGKGLPVSIAERTHARRLLLGTTELDRRSLWTIARTLGHSSPSTSIRCYLHAIELMTPFPHDDVVWDGSGVDLGAVIDLDATAVDDGYGSPATLRLADPLPLESLPLRRLRFLTLIAGGYKPDRAAQTARLAPDEVGDLAAQLDRLPGHGATGREILSNSAILRSISVVRWRALATLAAGASPSQLSNADLDPAQVIQAGARRQLVLHLRCHFAMAKAFLDALRLAPHDMRIVMVRGLHETKQRWIEEAGLKDFATPAAAAGSDFRVDTVEAGEPPEPVTHRAALVPSADPARRVQTTQEMLVLWVAMHPTPLRAAETGTQSQLSTSISAP